MFRNIYYEWDIKSVENVLNGKKEKMSSWDEIVRRTCSWIGLYYGIVSNLANENKYTTVLEIGNAYGLHLEEILKNCPQVHCTGVDPYQASYDPRDFFDEDVHKLMGGRDKQHSMDMLHDRVMLLLSPYEARFTQHRMHSWDAAPYVEDGSQDIVFIDGDHRYESVKRDIELYWPKVKAGGVLCGDDFGPAFPGVVRAVDEFGKAQKLRLERLYKNGKAMHWCYRKPL